MFSLRRKTKKDSTKHEPHLPPTEEEAVETAKTDKRPTFAQKRSHFRLECSIPSTIKLVNKNDSKQIALGDQHTSTIINLSSGGARLVTNFDLNKKDNILVLFKLEDDLIVLIGEVKFKTNCTVSDYRFQYGIMFTGSSTKDQDTICKYLFKEQMSSFS